MTEIKRWVDRLNLENMKGPDWREELTHARDREISELRQALDDCKKDAERYQWVRTAGAFNSEIGLGILSENPELYDAEVDSFIAYEKGAQ